MFKNWKNMVAIYAAVLSTALLLNQSRTRPQQVEEFQAMPAAAFEEDSIEGNYSGILAEVDGAFFASQEGPVIGCKARFEDGRSIAFVCRPSQYSAITYFIGKEIKILTGTRKGTRDWLLSAN